MTSEERAEAERLAEEYAKGIVRRDFMFWPLVKNAWLAGRESLRADMKQNMPEWEVRAKLKEALKKQQELYDGRLKAWNDVRAERERSQKLKGKIDDAIWSAIYEYYPGTSLAQQIAILETVQEVWNEVSRGE